MQHPIRSPVRRPIPIWFGGAAEPVLRRAARLGDGWIGMHHTPESVALPVKKLRDHLGMYPEKRDGFTITCSGLANHPHDVQAWSHAGVDRLIVTPWKRSPDALDGMKRFAEAML